jgi:hypothetical protein
VLKLKSQLKEKEEGIKKQAVEFGTSQALTKQTV